MTRSEDWMAQAKRDLESAQWALQGEFYEWACFICQQSAEKALKAVYEDRGAEAWGHSVYGLLKGLASAVEPEQYNQLQECARYLDRHYVPARYPNGWSEGSPQEHYRKEEADHALLCAQRIIRLCEHLLAG